MSKPKLIRTSTVSMSLDYLLKGQLSFLQNYYEVIAVSGNDIHLEEVAHREKVRTIGIEMQRNISPLKDLLSLWNLYVLFKKEKPLIVHSITPKAGLLTMTAGFFAGVPIRIHTFTGLIFPSKTGLLKRLLILMDKLLCKFATHVYPEGNGVKQDLINFGITRKPLKVIANGNVNGIDTDYFNNNNLSELENQTLKNALGINPNDFVFIFVGRLVGDKGINELITAFKKFNSTDAIKLLLVGPFEQELDFLLVETLHEIKVNVNIISVGFQKEVRSYFAIADALVFPSYREGFPNVVLQAGAMNLPSIVTDINGSNEIISDGINGIIIASKNSVELYEAMLELVNDAELRENLQKHSREMIVSRFEQKMVWEAILEEYKRVESNV
ncbi:RfaG Glycosyltransferase [Flavobacteriaceae bacterium]